MSQNRFEEDSGVLRPPTMVRTCRDEHRFEPKMTDQTTGGYTSRRRPVFWLLLYILGLAICWTEVHWFSHPFIRAFWCPLVLISTYRSRLLSSCTYAVFLSALWYVIHLASAGWGSVPGPQPMSVTLWEAGARLVASLFIVGIVYRYRVQILQYQQLQRVDALTGLLNYQALYERVEIELQRCHRTNEPLTVALLDCDNFKRINDSYGHQCGNEALQDVSSALQRQVRAYDLVARLGGDEFVIVFPGTDFATAQTIIDRLRSVLSSEKQNAKWQITMCWGVVTCSPPVDVTASELIDVADQQMYAAKRQGSDNVCYHNLVTDNSTKQTIS